MIDEGRRTDPGASARRDEELVFNTRLVEPMLRYFEDRFGADALAEIVRDSGSTLAVLRDPAQWISVPQLLRLSRAMVDRSGDPLVTYRAGLELLDPRVLGLTWFVARALAGPRTVYEKMTEFTPDLSRITRWKRIESGDHHVVVRFELENGHRDDPLFCLNRQGALAGIPKVFDLPLARVAQTACLHDGDPYCEYRVEWVHHARGAGVLPWLGSFAGIAAVPLALRGGAHPGAAIGAAVLAFVLFGVYTQVLERRAAHSAVDVREQLVAAKKIIDGNVRLHRERQLLEKVDLAARRELDRSALIATALDAVRNTLGYDRAMFLAVDDAQQRLVFAGGAGFAASALPRLRALSLKLEAPRSDELLFANILRSENGVRVADVAAFRQQINAANQALLDGLGSRAFVAVPVRGADVPLGLLVVDQVDADRTLGDHDHAMLQQVGHLVGLALANANLVENLRRERQVLQTALLLNQKFSQYLPRTVVDRIQLDPEAALHLGGQRRVAAVLFSDIVGFTPWSEVVEPETVVTFLNWYFEAMDRIVEETHGILDKRIGDGMMVVFLDADDREGPARRALRCGLRMQEAVARLTAMPERPREASFAVRVGVSYGEPVAGNLGSAHRLEYTVIGDTVNVASRLEGRCEPGMVFATEQALRAAGDGVRAEPRGELMVKGRSQPVSAFAILGVD